MPGSPLVRLVNALETVTSGTVTVDGIGMVFWQFNLSNSRTVHGNVAYPLQVAGVPRCVSELLHFVGLADKAPSCSGAPR